ncbi:50S ribosomal protein L15 [Oceanotoga sp. DSM 15011]|jgi:large subunit ribosomal protein L15|uniref:Large ribosomal subunit protein uL15 n=1 Tax=Oceanotoga teriensis TaxID=515440 RepID=A0AA45C655_9BACT|nr:MULTISPECIES: 50S ribosomal protein L15 [Oceanotoga]MDO7975629.1 50S ribosomal protein L15 [Oceanotoga teriensis]PWJ90622.1 LSU ribosomal protein L15P [Oceanotoga teriensis]UYO99865.1 50S ribosomal protein L15 [Oceanotoga sp. DSM 15011]
MALKIENLKPTQGSRFKSKRLGRGKGTGLGKTAGKGHKGAKSRSGYSVRIGFEGGQTPLYRRSPKFGFTNAPFKTIYSIVNLKTLEERFENNEEITVEKLLEKGIIHKVNDGVKVLGEGDLTKTFVVKANAFSKSAVSKIEAAGGKAEVI